MQKLRLQLFSLLFIALFLQFCSSPRKVTRMEGFKTFGIDVSRYQGQVNYQEVQKDNIKFVFIKATEGLELKDPTFAYNWANSRRNGLLRGAYHFFLPKLDPQLQLQNFTSSVYLQAGDLPPVVDVEKLGSSSPAELVRNLQIFLDGVEQHYGARPIIYTSYNFYRDYLDEFFSNYPLWIARYQDAPLEAEENMNWQFWQYTDNGVVEGVNGAVDINVFRGSEQALQALTLKVKRP